MHRGHGGINCTSQGIPDTPHTHMQLTRTPYKGIYTCTSSHQTTHNQPFTTTTTTMYHTMRHATCIGGMGTSFECLRAYHIHLIPVYVSPKNLIKVYRGTPNHTHPTLHTHNNNKATAHGAPYMHGGCGAITCTLQTSSPAPHIRIMPPPRPYKAPPAPANTATSGPPHPHQQQHSRLLGVIHAWGVWGHHIHTSDLLTCTSHPYNASPEAL
jgi:hypothetical protein